MTIAEVERRLRSIRTYAEAGEYEDAHEDEKALLVDLVRHMATNSSDAQARELCSRALDTLDIKFKRYFA